MGARSSASAFAILIPLVLLLVLASSLLGPTRLAWTQVWDPASSTIYWQLRVPRTILAALAGAGLSLGGAIFQTLFRNPLASPYTLGIDSGASLGAAIAYLCGFSGYWLGLPQLPLFAFLGAVGSMGLVYLMDRLRGGVDMVRLLLTGVCVAYLSAAGIVLVTFLADRTVTNEIVIWMMGSLATLREHGSLQIGLVLIPVVAFVLLSHRALDLLAMGEHLAASRGVRVDWTVWGSFALVGVLTAVIVANCGPVGFVGLMVPHIGRAVVGHRFLPLAVGSILIGAAFLAVCDGLARSILLFELPVGVVTNILGATFFFYLLTRREAARSTQR